MSILALHLFELSVSKTSHHSKTFKEFTFANRNVRIDKNISLYFMTKLHQVMANKSQEYKFVRDVIRYVLSEYWPGVHWNPTGMFLDHDNDSPFTPAVKMIIRQILDDNAVDLHRSYDEVFPVKNIFSYQHYELCQHMISSIIVSEIEDVKFIFLTLCASVSLYTALSVLYGIKEAPYISHGLILKYFISLRSIGLITNNFWNDLEFSCEQCLI